MTMTISRTDLARKTREIVEQVRRGETVIVESYGEEQIVLMDALDYRILRAVARHATEPSPENGSAVGVEAVVRQYLNEDVNLGRAAELLGISRWELHDRFHRLGVPLRMGPTTIEELREDVKVASESLSKKP